DVHVTGVQTCALPIYGVSEYYKLRTDGLLPGIYRIRYEFTNEFGATNRITRQIRVTAAPTSIIDVDNSCIDSNITFTESSNILRSEEHTSELQSRENL